MEFNPDKYEVMLLGRTNKTREYMIVIRILRSTENQRDIGVHVHWSVKRILRKYMIEMYKIIRGIDRVDRNEPFPLVEGSMTRSHRFK
eukprot:g47743.t1